MTGRRSDAGLDPSKGSRRGAELDPSNGRRSGAELDPSNGRRSGAELDPSRVPRYDLLQDDPVGGDATAPRPTTIDRRRPEHRDPARLSSTTDQRLLDSRGPA